MSQLIAEMRQQATERHTEERSQQLFSWLKWLKATVVQHTRRHTLPALAKGGGYSVLTVTESVAEEWSFLPTCERCIDERSDYVFFSVN